MYASIIEKLQAAIRNIPHVRINKKNCQKLGTKLSPLLEAIISLAHSKTFLSEVASSQLEELVDKILKFVEKSSAKSLFNGLHKSKLLAEYITLDHSLTELLLEEPKLLHASYDVAKVEVSAPVTVRQNSGSGVSDPDVIMRWIRQNTTISRSKAQLYATQLVHYGISSISSLLSAMQLQPDVLTICNIDVSDQPVLVAALRNYQGTPQVSPRYESSLEPSDMTHIVDHLFSDLKAAIRESNVMNASSTLRAISQACIGNVTIQTKFGQMGICTIISSCLYTSLASSTLCEAALQCICHLTRHGSTRDTSHEGNIIALGQAGACVGIIAALEAHSSIYNVLFWGAHAVLNLSINSHNSSLFGKAGACATITSLMQKQNHATQTEDSVSHYVWGALINLALNSDNNILLSEAGACRAVVDVWKSHRQNNNVALWGCMAVQNLSLNEKNNADLAELGVCRLVTYSIRHFPDDDMLAQAILAVQNLVSNPRNNAEFGRLGICEYITRTFDIEDSVKCQRFCTAIMNLSFKNTDNKLRFGRSCCALLMQVLLQCAEDPVIVENALGAIANLVDDVCTENIIHCGDLGVCDALLTVMRLHIEDEIICELSCWVVKSLGQYLPNAIVLGSGGVAELISRILRIFLGLESVVDMACFALEILAHNKDICFRLVRANAAEMIIKALQMHKQNERIVLHGCNTINTMCQSELCARSFQALSAYGVVSSAIKFHFANEDIQKVGFCVLKVLSSAPSTDTDIKPVSQDDISSLTTVTDAIVALNALRLAVYYQNEAYTLAALQCTYRLASSNVASHKILVSQGACEYIAYLFYPILSSAQGCNLLVDVIAVMARPHSSKESSNIEALSQFGESGLCRGCTLALKRCVADAESCLKALRAVTCLCSEKNAVRFGAAGCCEIVIEAISNNASDRAFAQQAWHALINLSLEESNCRRCFDACTLLVDAIRLWHVYADSMEWLILACHNLTLSEENRDHLLNIGIAPLLSAAIKEYSDLVDVAKYGSMTVQRLAQNPTGVSLLGNADICDALVMLLHVYIAKENVLEEILLSLVALCSCENCESFVNAGLCEILPKVMGKYAVENETIAENSAALVHYCCMHTSAAALFDTTTFKMITTLLTTHCTYEIVDHCCSSILYLCINNEANFIALKNMNAYAAMMAGIDAIATEHYISETCRRALVFFEPTVDSFTAASASMTSSTNSSPKAKKMSPTHRRESGDNMKDAGNAESIQQWQHFCDAMIARDNSEMLVQLMLIQKVTTSERQLVTMRTPSTMQIIFSALSSETISNDIIALLLNILSILLTNITSAQYGTMVGKLDLLHVIVKVLKLHYEMKSITVAACDCISHMLKLNIRLSCDTALLCDIVMHFMEEEDVLRTVLALLHALVKKYPASCCDINMLVCLLRQPEISDDVMLLLLSLLRCVAETIPLFRSNDIVVAMIVALQLHASDLDACEALLTTLSFGLSKCVSTEVPIITVDDFDTLMCVIREHDGSSTLCAMGWRCISVLLQCQTDNCDRFISAHGAVLLKLSFGNWQSNEVVLRHLLQICVCLNRRSDIELSISETLASILQYYTSDAAIAKASQGQSNCNDILALALQNIVSICEREENQRIAFGEMNCCEHIIAAMTLILKSEAVVIHACNAIRALAKYSPNMAKFTSIGAFTVVLRILQKNYTSYDIAFHGLLALQAVPDFDQICVVYDVIQKVIGIHIQTEMTDVCLALLSQFSLKLLSSNDHVPASNGGKNHGLPLYAIEFAAQTLERTDHPSIIESALIVLLHAVHITPDLNDLPLNISNLFEAIANKFELAVLPSLKLLKSLMSNDVTILERLCELNFNNLLLALTKSAGVVLTTLEVILLFSGNLRNKMNMIQHSVIVNALQASIKHQPHEKIAENMLSLLLVCSDNISVPPIQYDALMCHSENSTVVSLWLDLLIRSKDVSNLDILRRIVSLLDTYANSVVIAEKCMSLLASITLTDMGRMCWDHTSFSSLLNLINVYGNNDVIVYDGLSIMTITSKDEIARSACLRNESDIARVLHSLSVILCHQSDNKRVVVDVVALLEDFPGNIDPSVLSPLIHKYITHKELLQRLLFLLSKSGSTAHMPELMHDLHHCYSLHMADTSIVQLLCQIIQKFAENDRNVNDLMNDDLGARLLQVHSVHLHRALVLTSIYHTAVALIADEAHCRELGKKGFCEVVYETCRDVAEGTGDYVNNFDLKIAAVQLLSQLSCVDDNKNRLIAAGLCAYIPLFLPWRGESWHMLNSILRLVINISASGGAVLEQLGIADVSAALGEIIVEHMKDAEIVRLVLWAVMNLAIDDGNKVTLGTPVICSAVISALKLHAMDVADVGLGAIINLCDNNETNKVQLAGCYVSIVDMLRNGAVAHLCAMCGMAIVNLTENCVENAAVYNTQELVELLYAQLQKHGEVAEVVEQVSWSLHILSKTRPVIAEEQMIGITKLAYRYRKVAPVVEHLIFLLRNWQYLDLLSAPLVSRLCNVLPEVLIAQSSNEVVAEQCCEVVEALLSHPASTFQHELLQQSMLGVLMSLYENDSIVLLCVRILNVSFPKVFLADSIEPYFEAVLKAMRTQFLLEEVVIQCCCVLRTMASRVDDSAEIMARYGACETAIAALESHVSDKALPHICEFICSLCERSANCYMLGTAGACEAVVDALQQHDSMSAITRECCLAAVVALLKHESNGATYRETNLWRVLLQHLVTDAARAEEAMRLLTSNYSAEVLISANDIAVICQALVSNSPILTPLIQYCCKFHSINSSPAEILTVLEEIQEALQLLRSSNGDQTVQDALVGLAQSIARGSDVEDVQQLLCIILDAANA